MVTRIVAWSWPIEAPAQAVWRLLTDTARWVEWGPSVKAVECPARHLGPGSRGRVRTALGFWVPFVVIEWVEGHYWAWRVAGVRATGHRVEPLGADRSVLTFDLPVPAFPYLLVCGIAARRIARLLLRQTPQHVVSP